ncbi:MAG: hypothetical protein IJL87_00760 [Clostridia bacterium]|nr:hypothetical protein [Clostridia bacterium]
MYIIPYSIKQKLKDKKKFFQGLKVCDSCGELTETYLAKRKISLNLLYFIPIFGISVGRFQHCKGCDTVYNLSREYWKEAKEKAKTMPKRDVYLKAYEELKAIVDAKGEAELDADSIYGELIEKVKVKEKSAVHIKELVGTYLAFLAGKKAAAEAAEKAALEAENQADGESEKAASDSGTTVGTLPETTAPAVSEQPEKVLRKKTRLLWLLLAIPLLLGILLVIAATVYSVVKEGKTDLIIGAVIMLLIPVLLDILFFVLALKKTKKAKNYYK